jgi:hypothetical protein
MAPLDGQQLCWSSGHKNDLVEVGVPQYLGLAMSWYVYGPAKLVGHPGYVTFRGRCALVALPACSGHQGFYIENEGLPVGCAPNGPAKYFWVLGRSLF